MIFDLRRLNSNIDSSINVDLKYDFTSDELKNTDLINCNIHVKGEIYKNVSSNLAINFIINGVMVLPCAITLKPVNYPFSIEIDDEIDEFIDNFNENYQNTIDIFPIIWENILMEIPMRVVSEGAEDIKLEGDGWRLITDEKNSSPFDELKDLFE